MYSLIMVLPGSRLRGFWSRANARFFSLTTFRSDAADRKPMYCRSRVIRTQSAPLDAEKISRIFSALVVTSATGQRATKASRVRPSALLLSRSLPYRL
jgi:hypothetical protein